MTARFDLASYTHALSALMPKGRAWNTEQDSNLSKLVAALAATFRDSDFSANALIVDAFPASAVGLLAEWEETLGLPDNCLPAMSTAIATRQSAAVAAFVNIGGQNAQRYHDIAAAFGIGITIAQFSPSRFGASFGQPFGGEDWAFAWQISIPPSSYSSTPLTFGQQFGQPFASLTNLDLWCALKRSAPAHTVLMLAPQSAVAALDINFYLDTSLLG